MRFRVAVKEQQGLFPRTAHQCVDLDVATDIDHLLREFREIGLIGTHGNHSLTNAREGIDVLDFDVRKRIDKLDFKVRERVDELPLAALVGKSIDALDFQIGKAADDFDFDVRKGIDNFDFAIKRDALIGAPRERARMRRYHQNRR